MAQSLPFDKWHEFSIISFFFKPLMIIWGDLKNKSKVFVTKCNESKQGRCSVLQGNRFSYALKCAQDFFKTKSGKINQFSTKNPMGNNIQYKIIKMADVSFCIRTPQFINVDGSEIKINTDNVKWKCSTYVLLYENNTTRWHREVPHPLDNMTI